MSNVQRHDPIAIIGIGCRFPGANGPSRFWQLLLDAVDAVDDHHDDDLGRPLPTYPDWQGLPRSGLLDKIDEFDAEFFGMSPREAQRTDPQARLLLETSWEALEDAGLNPDRLAGSRTGVFVGQAASNYWELVRRAGRPDIHAVVGSEVRATLPGRVSFTFDFRGPSVSVDTACSASLTAAHQACQSIRAGESVLALAAGVNLVLLQDEGIAYSQANMTAPDGRCKFGDASADGFVRSDGVGVVVLKPLDAAIADGDRVYATILGSAINNDGRSSGLLMTPSGTSQEDLLRYAYRDAGVAPGCVDYVEAHGAGTSIGDPVELTALGNVLSEGRAADQPCLVGSVKTNIGHAEAAAGIAGLIKTALCLHHRTIPASLHFREPNPAVAWQSLPILVPTECAVPAHRDRPVIAGVNSFGISGANAHMVLAEHASRDQASASSGPLPPEPQILVLSAQSPEALRELATSYADFLGPGGAGGELDLRDICGTAARRRKHLAHRLAVIGNSHREIEQKLRDHGADRAGCVAGSVAGTERPRLVFAFPGQGSQWLGMGQDLLRTSPEFREAMYRCDEAIQAEIGVSIVRQLEAGGSRLTEVDVLQPALWAIEVALCALWRGLGIEPDIVVGHSMGEIAAACVAGVLDVADAAAVVCRRSRLARRLSGRGAMAAVALPEEKAAEAIADYPDKVVVAAGNSPSSTILSGDPASLRAILDVLESRGVPHKLLDVDFASHSPQMDAITGELRQALLGIRPRPGRIPVYSTVTDEIMDASAFSAEYWAENLRRPVRFATAVSHIGETAPALFLEISPHPTLVGAIRETLSQRGIAGTAVESLRREQPAWPCLLESLATIHVLGGPVDWERLTGQRRCVQLPSYAWQHKRHWISKPPGSAASPEAGGNQGEPENACATRVVTRPFELAGHLRLLDHADRIVAEISGARLQFVASEGGGIARGHSPAAVTGPAEEPGPGARAPDHPGTGGSVVGQVARVLGLPADDVDTSRSLLEIGLDSLMASELASRLRTNLGLSVTPATLLADRSLADVTAALGASADRCYTES